jgi:hypothetical protein
MTKRSAVAVVLLAAQVACLGPRQERGPAMSYVKAAAPERIWITTSDGSSHELTGPQVVLDSLLTGWTKEGTEFIAFPLADVRSLSSREPSTGRTFALVGTIGAAATVGLILLASGTGGQHTPREGEGGGDDNTTGQ